MDLAEFLPAVTELLAVRSTADRPAELHRALDFVLDFVGPGFTVERFESAGKPSALLLSAGADRSLADHREPGQDRDPERGRQSDS